MVYSHYPVRFPGSGVSGNIFEFVSEVRAGLRVG